ncbi:hypothetical protein RD110_22700 [Rhodoferax koreense]|uniref:Porin domain-containing protein n=1 Tax=Rhodoferax koreensis TaxID=1842727 RepID=A0A1P8K0Z6_9BURK|nr:porin [Rhodoferax koreense]APW39667.1 hypothetical protein RD110_22700 [Rhodoferax koreense]
MGKQWSAIALVGGCALVSGTAYGQSSVSLYGLLDTGITYTNRNVDASGQSVGHRLSVHPGAMQASRLGFRGTEDLGCGLKTLFVIESGINLDTGTAAQGGLLFGRRSVVGMQGGSGTVLAGRQPDFLDDMGALSSTLDFGSQVSTIHGLDRTYTDRTNNSVRYTSPRIAGVMGTAMIGFGENATVTSGRALGAGLDYTDDKLRLAAGYYQSQLGVAGSASSFADTGAANIGAQPPAAGVVGVPGDVALRTFTLGAAYQWGNTRLHGTWSNTVQPLAVASASRALRGPGSERVNVLDLGVSYAVTAALNLNASVIHDKVKFVAAPSGSLTQYNLGLDYFLSKRTDLYANAGYQTASRMLTPGMGEGAPGGSSSQVLTRVGIRHKF